jgi:hypothetical protein
MRVAACLLSVAAASAHPSDGTQKNALSYSRNRTPAKAVFAPPPGRMMPGSKGAENFESVTVSKTVHINPSAGNFDVLRTELELMATSHSKEVGLVIRLYLKCSDVFLIVHGGVLHGPVER